jgi:hypothetical protein
MVSVKEFIHDYLNKAHTSEAVMLTLSKYRLEELLSVYANMAIEESFKNEDITKVKEKL